MVAKKEVAVEETSCSTKGQVRAGGHDGCIVRFAAAAAALLYFNRELVRGFDLGLKDLGTTVVLKVIRGLLALYKCATVLIFII